MSWCPKCKNEYRAGITVCPDCNEELMEELTEAAELEFVPLFQTDNEELLSKLVKYLTHCGHKVQEQSGEVETEEGLKEVTAIFVPKKDYAEAIQEIRTVLMYDAKQEAGEEEDLKPRHRAPEPSTLYVDAKSRYQEYKSSGIMFLAFAVFFLIFGILNLAGVITIFASVPSLIIVFGATVAFSVIGVNSLRKVSSLKEEASSEEKTSDEINEFLKETFSKEKLLKGFSEEEISGELLYFQLMELMKEKTAERFPDADENYLDALLEDYYNSLDI